MNSSTTNHNQSQNQNEEVLTGIRHRLSKLGNLTSSSEFRWFLEEMVKSRLTEAQERALDTKLSMEERDKNCHIRESLAEIYNWADEELKDALSRIKILDPD